MTGPHFSINAGRGVAIWSMIAAALVIGILIGFGSGYTAGRRAEAVLVLPPVTETAGQPSAADETPSAFTEGTVAEPVRVDPAPIVTAPEEDPSPAPAPAARSVRASESGPPAAPRIERPAPAAAPRVERAAPAVAVPSGRGALQILSRPPGAEVTLDGRVIGRTPLVVADVAAGRHDVRIELAGFRTWATTVRVDGAARTRVAASLEQ